MSYYDSQANANMHPLRKAYAQFEIDKANCLMMMSSAELMFKQYTEHAARLERLKEEQSKLVSIMPPDLTADILVDHLSGIKPVK